MSWQDRIAVDPAVLAGKPIIKGTRIAVEFLIELLAETWTREQILSNYPQLTEDDTQAALHYAVETLKRERVYPLAVRHGPPPGERECIRFTLAVLGLEPTWQGHIAVAEEGRLRLVPLPR